MPRKKKSKTNEPTAIAETLDTLKEEITGLKNAVDLPRQLPPPEPELLPLPRSEQEPPQREVIVPDTNPDRHRPTQRRNGAERPSFAEQVGKRPAFLPVPDGFKNVARHEAAGIRVNKGVECHNAGTAALQFAEDRPLSRATEYDLMEVVQEAGFQFKPATRQWERPLPAGKEMGENTIEAVRLAKDLADARDPGRGR